MPPSMSFFFPKGRERRGGPNEAPVLQEQGSQETVQLAHADDVKLIVASLTEATTEASYNRLLSSTGVVNALNLSVT